MDQLRVDNILSVEHDIFPFNGTDVFQQRNVDAAFFRVALRDDPGDFFGLPVDDASQNQR